MRISEIIEYLDIIRNKGNCFATIRKAKSTLDYLRGHIKDDDWNEISTAINHMDIGEGPTELTSKIKILKNKLLNHDRQKV